MSLEELARSVVGEALKQGFEEAAVLLTARRSCMAKFANNIITVVQYWRDYRASIYLTKARRIYVASLNTSRASDLLDAVRSARQLVERVEESELYAELPEPTGRPLGGLADKAVIDSIDETPDIAAEAVNEALSSGAERVAGMVELGEETVTLSTSRGACMTEHVTHVKAYVRAFGPKTTGHWAYCSTRLSRRAVRETARRAAEYAALRLDKVSVEPGRYDAILSPLVAGNLIDEVASSASAFHVMTGFSPFAKYGPGSRIGSDKLTIIDDPRDPTLPGSRGFDDEGIETRRKPIIENGVVRTLLHNTKTARKMNSETTGNAGWIDPHPWNIVVEPGDASLDEMVAEVRRGFLVLNNWYTRYQNAYEGVFSTVTRDALIYIEDGEFRGVLERLRIADTIPHLLGGVEMLGREAYDVSWWEVPIPTRIPYILVRGLMFTKPSV